MVHGQTSLPVPPGIVYSQAKHVRIGRHRGYSIGSGFCPGCILLALGGVLSILCVFETCRDYVFVYWDETAESDGQEAEMFRVSA